MQKVWFITGAAKGIGNAVANEVLKAGNCVVATIRKENDFAIPQEYSENVLALTLDVSNTNEEIYNTVVSAAVKKFGKIDVLVNNAGFGAITNFEETSEEAIRRLFEVNVFGLMRVTRAVLPIMRQQRNGHIFNIASGAGYCAGPVPYHTSKFAVTGFSTSLAFEVAPFGSQSGYSQSAALLAHNLIAAIAAFQWELVLPLKQANPHPPLMPLRH